jgi:HEAT repeat protein
VSGHGDGGQRVAAINHLGSVLEEWRVLPATVLSLLGGQLRAPEPDVRFRAAYLLAGIGQEARPFTDALAELTADASAVGSFGGRTAVSDAAVWAL